jgi:hypothetical protein
VEPAECADQLVDGGLNLIAVRDVGRDHYRLSARRSDPVGHGSCSVLLPIKYAHLSAAGGQAERDRFADSLCATGHECNAVLDSRHLLFRVNEQSVGRRDQSGRWKAFWPRQRRPPDVRRAVRLLRHVSGRSTS